MNTRYFYIFVILSLDDFDFYAAVLYSVGKHFRVINSKW